MKRVLITGGTGFVGANLVHRLLMEGHELHLLVRNQYNPVRIKDIQKDVRLHRADIADRERLFELVADIRPEWIFHLAVQGAYYTQIDERQIVETNIIGTINLVEACLKTSFESFVNTGSSSEYGLKKTAHAEEDHLEPNSYYAVTKASSTMFCRYIAKSRGVHIPSLRLYSVYGPYEESCRLIPAIITCGLKGKLPPLVNPDTARDFVFAEDVNDAYILAANVRPQDPGAVYNVGTGKQTTIREVVETARRLMNIRMEPVWESMPGRQWDTDTWIADNHLIQDKLGWCPKYTFEQGLRVLVERAKIKQIENPLLLA